LDTPLLSGSKSELNVVHGLYHFVRGVTAIGRRCVLTGERLKDQLLARRQGTPVGFEKLQCSSRRTILRPQMFKAHGCEQRTAGSSELLVIAKHASYTSAGSAAASIHSDEAQQAASPVLIAT
jgi:hypothetical protein